MQPTISLQGQRASATIFCGNLILKDAKLIVLLTAFGPTQEVRAFAQILNDREAPLLKLPGQHERRVAVGGTMSLIGKIDNGYLAGGMLDVTLFGTYLVNDKPARHSRA